MFYGGFTQGLAKIKEGKFRQQAENLQSMVLAGWGKDNPAFRQFFTSLFMPGATKEQMDWFNDLQRTTISPDTAAELLAVAMNSDVTGQLSKLNIPTLVLHCREDAVAPFEGGRRIAAGIPNARFVALEGQNHMILEDEPAWPRFMSEVRNFLAEGDQTT